MKDDVFKALTKPDEGSKDYMREMTSSVSEDSEFQLWWTLRQETIICYVV